MKRKDIVIFSGSKDLEGGNGHIFNVADKNRNWNWNWNRNQYVCKIRTHVMSLVTQNDQN